MNCILGLSSLILNKTNKVIVVSNFNIHVDIDEDRLNVGVSVGFSWCAQPTHCFNHTLDLVLTYGFKFVDV